MAICILTDRKARWIEATDERWRLGDHRSHGHCSRHEAQQLVDHDRAEWFRPGHVIRLLEPELGVLALRESGNPFAPAGLNLVTVQRI
jgi:hypothetical protein